MTTQEQIAVMQAYADGKKIQWRDLVDDTAWVDTDEPVWNWGVFEYRVKPEPELPKTWEEYKKRHKINNGTPLELNFTDDKQELINAFEALSKLVQLRNCYNDGWQPDWEDNTDKYIIFIDRNDISRDICTRSNVVLAFKTAEIRNEFYENFKDLILTAKPLL